MDADPDLAAARHRTLTCGKGTAVAVARAAVRTRVLPRRLAVLLVVVGLLGGTPLAVSGHPIAGLVQALLSIVFIALVVVATAYRRARAGARALFPAGTTVVLDLRPDALTLRTALGEQQVPYAGLRAPRRVAGQVLLPMGDTRGHLTLPAGLLPPEDVEWLAQRIAACTSSAPSGERPHDPSADDDADWPHEVMLTEEVVSRMARAVVRYRLLGRVGQVRAVVVVTLWLWLGVVTGRWLLATGLTLALVVVGVVVSVAATRRTVRRAASSGVSLRARFDDGHLHLDGPSGRASVTYAAVRRVVVVSGDVLLVTRTGMMQLLPREIVPGDALARLRDATGVGSAR